MAGQNHHFGSYAPEKIPYAIDRYVNETGRLYAVLDRQLRGREFIVGEYSIADMACYPWITAGAAAAEHRRVPRPEALEVGDRGATCDTASLRDREDDQRQACDQRRGIAEDPFRPGQAYGALNAARHVIRALSSRPAESSR